MTSRVGPKGQVVLPKEFRDRLGIVAGSSVTFRLRAADRILEVHPSWADPITDGPRAIQALTRAERGGSTATQDLLELRAEDESLWQEQFDRWQARRTSSTLNRSLPSSTANPGRI